MNIPAKEIITIIKATRDLTLPHFGNIEVKAYKSASARDAVTEIDQAVETQLKADLKKILPEIPFVGEEFGGDRESDTFWLVDPIDATGHFIRGIPFCTTMLALIDGGQVVFSVIYDFVNDDVYYAERDKGAYKNDQRIFVSDRPLQKAYISCEINSQREENKALLSAIRSKANILHTLSAGFVFMLVACGKTEGLIVYDGFGKDYDFAPGTLLVQEAGGIVRNFKSDSYNYKNLNFIASNQTIYDELVGSSESIEDLMQ
jgi:myo-inositol-1(or 4)-monophosphatase